MVTPEHLEDRIELHEAQREHGAGETEVLRAEIEALKARCAELETEAHRHEYEEDDEIEEVTEE